MINSLEEIVIIIDKNSKVPQSRQLAEQIKVLIKNKKFSRHKYLPGERKLAAHAGVSRDVVFRAYKILAEEKVIKYANHIGHSLINRKV